MGGGTRRPENHSWREHVRLAKHGQSVGETAWCVAIHNDAGTYLGSMSPVRKQDAESPDTCAALTRWREVHRDKFLTQFTPTAERTRSWLTNVVLPDDTRILFLIRDDAGSLVGNIGLCNMSQVSAEVDNVLRGEKCGTAGLVYFATLSLLGWAFRTLNVAVTWLQVFHRNDRAIRLYQMVGFMEAGCKPLWRTEMNGDIRLVPDPVAGAVASDIELLRMELTRDEFERRHAWVGMMKEDVSWSH